MDSLIIDRNVSTDILINLKLNKCIDSFQKQNLTDPTLLVNIRSQGGRVGMHKAGYMVEKKN